MSSSNAISNKVRVMAIIKKPYKFIRKGLHDICDEMIDFKDKIAERRRNLPRSIRSNYKRNGDIYDITATFVAAFLCSIYYLYTGALCCVLLTAIVGRKSLEFFKIYVKYSVKGILKHIRPSPKGEATASTQ